MALELVVSWVLRLLTNYFILQEEKNVWWPDVIDALHHTRNDVEIKIQEWHVMGILFLY